MVFRCKELNSICGLTLQNTMLLYPRGSDGSFRAPKNMKETLFDLPSEAVAPSRSRRNGKAKSGDSEYRRIAESYLPRLSALQQWMGRRQEKDRRAFIVEFAGMPKAGKSLAIENLRHFFSHGHKLKIKSPNGTDRYRVHAPAEGVSQRTPNYFKHNLADYNTWAGAYSLQALIEASHDTYHDLVILDRGPWDAGCWLEHAATSELSHFGDSKEERDAAPQIVKFFQSTRWMGQSDLHVVLVVDHEEAARRESEQRLIQPQGASSDSVLMKAMSDIYQSRFYDAASGLKITKSKLCPLVGEKGALFLDTTGKDPKSVALTVIDATLQVLEAKNRRGNGDSPLTEDEVLSQFLPVKLVARVKRDKEFMAEAVLPWIREQNEGGVEKISAIRSQAPQDAMPDFGLNSIRLSRPGKDSLDVVKQRVMSELKRLAGPQ